MKTSNNAYFICFRKSSMVSYNSAMLNIRLLSILLFSVIFMYHQSSQADMSFNAYVKGQATETYVGTITGTEDSLSGCYPDGTNIINTGLHASDGNYQLNVNVNNSSGTTATVTVYDSASTLVASTSCTPTDSDSTHSCHNQVAAKLSSHDYTWKLTSVNPLNPTWFGYDCAYVSASLTYTTSTNTTSTVSGNQTISASLLTGETTKNIGGFTINLKPKNGGTLNNYLYTVSTGSPKIKATFSGTNNTQTQSKTDTINIFFIPSPPTSSNPSFYTVTDLGTLGGSYSFAMGINDDGQVVGSSNLSGDSITHAFIYSKGFMKDIGTLGDKFGIHSRAMGINNLGLVVGYTYNQVEWQEFYEEIDQVHPRAFLYINNQMKDIGNFGYGYNVANAINNQGQIVGWADTVYGTINPWGKRAFIYDYKSNSIKMIDTFPKIPNSNGNNYDSWEWNSEAYGINDNGKVVGWSDSFYTNYGNNYIQKAFVYTNGILQSIWGDLRGIKARRINSTGQVVGIGYSTLSNQICSFLYVDGILTEIDGLGGIIKYEWPNLYRLYGINNAGLVVGSSPITGNAEYHAFLYANGEVQDLNSLVQIDGFYLMSASGINNKGQIIANGSNGHAYLLSPRQLSPILSVLIDGNGTVTSNPIGISCGSTCNVGFPIQSSVTLNATPQPGFVFTGWSGACTGNGPCVVIMNDVKSVKATFKPFPLSAILSIILD